MASSNSGDFGGYGHYHDPYGAIGDAILYGNLC